jgi:two-component system, LytTR family, response regulator
METKNCIIVEPNRVCSEKLKAQLNSILPHVNVVAFTNNWHDALAKIDQHHPCIILLNMATLPTNALMTFEFMLRQKCVVIAMATSDEYAIRAIKANAIDYLLQPITDKELTGAFAKALNVLALLEKSEQNKMLWDEATQQFTEEKLSVKVGSFYELVSTQEIVFCKANNNYTEIMMNDKRKFLLSKTLKFYETKLQHLSFCRIHQSFLVNTRFIKSVEKGRYSQLVLQDGTSLDIAQARKERVFHILGV